MYFSFSSLSLLLLCTLLYSCNNSSNNSKAGNYDAEYDMVSYAQQDSMMNAATDKANATFPMFVQAFKNPTPQMSRYYIKMEFEYGTDGSSEHIWFGEPHYKNDSVLYAIVTNEVVYIDGLAFGDTLPVITAQVTDWMYVENDTLRGGYTTRVIWASMSEKEKADFEKQNGYTIK